MSNRDNNVVVGAALLVAGGIIGAGVALLFAPQSGERTRKDLVRLGKKLKKYNVAVDVVNFGEQNDNAAKLEAFVNAVDSGNRCEASPGYHRRTRISPHPRV